jgi:hypothetical protein
LAQVERRELPVLRGESPPPAPGAPSEMTPPGREDWRPANPQPQVPQIGGGEPGESALPLDAWRGLDASALERLLARAPLPSSSPSLATLMARTLAIDPSGESGEARLAALERAGRVEELIGALQAPAAQTAPDATRYALALLALGREEEACTTDLGVAAAAAPAKSEAKRAVLLLPAYCAAAKGDRQGAALALRLARDGGVDTGLAAGASEGAAKGLSRRAQLPKSVDVLDYLFLKLGQSGGDTEIAARATPELLFLLARDKDAAAELRLAAAERGAALNVVDGEALGAAYAQAAPALAKSAPSPADLRARLFTTLGSQTSAKIRGESIDALLASGKDARIEIPMAEALARASNALGQDQQVAAFAETGLRVAALAGEDQTAWDFAAAAGQHAQGWQLLLAAQDPGTDQSGRALDEGVAIAQSAELPGALLQRLVTVLDALGVDVPIPLWDLAGKTSQPDDGFLPETGLLTTLKEAADAGEVGRTVLLAAAAFGPDGPQGAHLIALGDGLRALRRVGLDAEARRIAFEALYAHWPSRGKA